MPGYVVIDSARCNECGKCVRGCPTGAISRTPGGQLAVDQLKCDGCGDCFSECPQRAIALSSGAEAVLWLLAGGGRAAMEADSVLSSAVPGFERGALVGLAREILDHGFASAGRPAAARAPARAPARAEDGGGAVKRWIDAASVHGADRLDSPTPSPPAVIAYSVEMGRVLQLAAKVAAVDTTVLLLGESGAGKEVVARFIHSTSPRRRGPFVNLNCGAIPATLLESELFGYESGAFTGARREGKPGIVEVASGGTLFLDEISELPSDLQVKLLQLIQERKVVRVGGVRPLAVDIRIIAATNRDLAAMVARGEFRVDLFYRLNVVPITIPPLRERPDDVIPLIYHFLDKYNKAHGYQKTMSEEAREVLARYSWPGNVRELENLIERLVVTVEADEIGASDLPQYVFEREGARQPTVVVGGIMPLRQATEEVERQIIERALSEEKSTYGMAKLLGVNQSTVVRKIKKYLGSRTVVSKAGLRRGRPRECDGPST